MPCKLSAIRMVVMTGIVLAGYESQASTNPFVLPDGRILLAGTNGFTLQGHGPNSWLMRLNPDGSLDPSFGACGRVDTNFAMGASDTGSLDVILADDRGILVSGTTSTFYRHDDAVSYKSIGYLERYDLNGVLDPSFGNAATPGRLQTFALDGKAPVGKQAAYALDARSNTLVTVHQVNDAGRLETSGFRDGAFDRTFGEDGHLLGFNVKVTSADGTMLAVRDDARGNKSIVRLMSNGSIDPSFGHGSGGVQSQLDAVLDIGTQSDGSILLLGQLQGGRLAVERLDHQGARDLTFGKDGLVIATNVDSWPVNSLIQDDGKIVVTTTNILPAGRYQQHERIFTVIRLDADGSVDDSFGEDGEVIVRFASSAPEWSTLERSDLQSDGKIIVAGWAFIDSHFYNVAARIMPNGALDATFGNGGKVILSQ